MVGRNNNNNKRLLQIKNFWYNLAEPGTGVAKLKYNSNKNLGIKSSFILYFLKL